MTKLNQKIVLFIEQAGEAYQKPSQIGTLFMNRFAIEEDAKNEILKIYQLERPLYHLLRDGSLEGGLDLINFKIAFDS